MLMPIVFLTSELRQLQMTNGYLNKAFCQFQAYRHLLKTETQFKLIKYWLQMLEPVIEYIVYIASDNPKAIDEAVAIVCKAIKDNN